MNDKAAMNLKKFMSIYLFLVSMVTVAALNLNPKSAEIAFKHLNIAFAPDAIGRLQYHGLWAPSAVGLNGLEPMFGSNCNATLENDRFEASGLDINDLIRFSFRNDRNEKTTRLETGISEIDVCHPYPSCCDACHKCEGGCVSIIIFFIIPWLLCSAACWSQDFCKGCDLLEDCNLRIKSQVVDEAV